MKNTSKRIIAAIIALVLMTSVFTACGKTKDNPAPETDNQNSESLENDDNGDIAANPDEAPAEGEANADPTGTASEADNGKTSDTGKNQSANGSTATDKNNQNTSPTNKVETPTKKSGTSTTPTSPTKPLPTSPAKPQQPTSPAKPQPTNPQPTNPQPTKPPATTTPSKPSNPYKYNGAWGSIEKMENDCEAYVKSLGGTYHRKATLGTGSWIDSVIGLDSEKPEDYKRRVFESIKYHMTEMSGASKDIRVIFVTVDNCKDGRCAEYANDIYLHEFTGYPLNENVNRPDKIAAFIVYNAFEPW